MRFYVIVNFNERIRCCRFPPTAATVSSSLLLGICGLPDTIFRVTRAFQSLENLTSALLIWI